MAECKELESVLSVNRRSNEIALSRQIGQYG